MVARATALKAGAVRAPTGPEGRLPLPELGQVRAAAKKATYMQTNVALGLGAQYQPNGPRFTAPMGEWSKIYHLEPSETKKNVLL